jgi:hypothetical protein
MYVHKQSKLKIFGGQYHSFWIYFIYRYSMEVDKKIYTYNISVALLVVLSARCGLAAWMHWSSIDEIVLWFESVDELYPYPPLGVDSADSS